MRSSGYVKQKRPASHRLLQKSLTVSYSGSGLCRGSSHKHSQPDCGVCLIVHRSIQLEVFLFWCLCSSYFPCVCHAMSCHSNYPCLTLCSAAVCCVLASVCVCVSVRSIPTWPSMSTCALVCVIVYTLVIWSHCFSFFVSPPLGAVSLSLYMYVSRPLPLDVCATEGSGAADGVAPWGAQQTAEPSARRDQWEAEDHRRLNRVSASFEFLTLRRRSKPGFLPPESTLGSCPRALGSWKQISQCAYQALFTLRTVR